MEDVDWQHGGEHMWSQHQVSIEQANEALADTAAVVIDPDTKSRSGQSARHWLLAGCGRCADGDPGAP